MIRSLLLLVVALLAAGPARAEVAPGVLAARVWGLAKYHHPQLTRCLVDWDQALLDRWAALESADTGPLLDNALRQLLDAAGAAPGQPPDAQTPDWIVQAPLGEALRQRLAWLAAQRPQQQCKVTATPGTGQANFDADQDHATPSPDRAHRALAALRYWNAIEYFFPYREDIGRDWAEVLAEHLPQLLDAEPGLPFVHAMRRFSAEINDSHAGMVHPFQNTEFGAGFAPLSVRPVQGRSLVVQLADAAQGFVARGDELLEVDGEAVAARLARLDRLGFGSNPTVRWVSAHRFVTAGDPVQAQLRLRRPDGSEYEVVLPRSYAHTLTLPPPQVWRVEPLAGCRIGVIDMARLRPEDVPGALQDLFDTDALLFDIRNYPQGTMWPLVDRLFDAPRPMAELSFPRFDQPGHFDRRVNVLGGRFPIGYRGRFLLLQNDSAISQSEFSLMGLQADGRAISFGSQTAAADGNITYIHTPGELRLTITGLGVFYPDGRITQRVGIVPDLHLTPTRQGVIEGRDEVLQAALDCRWIEAEAPRRRPPQGLFAAPERDGEGIDVQRDAGGTVAVFSYHYDADGRPEWLLSVDNDAESAAQQGFLAFRRDGTVEPRAGLRLDFHAGPYFPSCAIADQSTLHPRARWQFPAAGGAGESCVLPLLGDAYGPASGTWAGAGGEDGWGVSIHHVGTMLALVVYAYDGGGHPRWLLGQAEWDGEGAAHIALLRTRGFCQGCPPSPVEFEDAGELRLEFAALDAVEGHRLHIDADFGDGVRWQRADMPLLRVSRPAAH